MDDYERSGCPKETTTDENVELMHSLIKCDRKSLRDIARYVFGGVQSILTDGNVQGLSHMAVSRMLIKDQKTSRLDISKELLSLYEDGREEFMHLVNQDETCTHHFDPGAKKQSMK